MSGPKIEPFRTGSHANLDRPRARLNGRLAGLLRAALAALLMVCLFASPSMAHRGSRGTVAAIAHSGAGWSGHGWYGRGWYGRAWYGQASHHRRWYPYAAFGLYGYPWYYGYDAYPSFGYAAAPVASAQYWFWCPNPAGYYPAVPACPTQWQLVPPQ